METPDTEQPHIAGLAAARAALAAARSRFADAATLDQPGSANGDVVDQGGNHNESHQRQLSS